VNPDNGLLNPRFPLARQPSRVDRKLNTTFIDRFIESAIFNGMRTWFADIVRVRTTHAVNAFGRCTDHRQELLRNRHSFSGK
jgi:hypothetical protein